LSYETDRHLEGTIEADELYHTAGNKGQAKQRGKKHLGRRPRSRRKKREPGQGHYDEDRPAMIAWVSRHGAVVVQPVKDFTVKTVQQAANLAVQAGSRLYTDSASSYRALQGYLHEFVNHTQQEYGRGEVHENRARQVFELVAAERIREAFDAVEALPPDLRVVLEPFVTAHCLHSSPNATANATCDVIRALRRGRGSVVGAQVRLAGEFLELQTSIGVPVLVNAAAWSQVVCPPLADDEAHQLRAAAATITANLAQRQR
jgi:hypothetical protein